MRKLASIQLVDRLEAIPNADAIEKARVLGWSVVVKRGEFQVGDKIVYCEIDSLLPERPEFEFLRPSSFKPAQVDPVGLQILPAGFRIKTVKLRGQVSQGICFPISILAEPTGLDIGADVTSQLGIIKWEPPMPVGMSGRVKGQFPAFLPKTDETRVQVLQDVLIRHRGKTFAVTEKLDGTSFSAFLWQNEFGICSRNLWLDETDESHTFTRLAISLQLHDRLRALRDHHQVDVALQAEVIGPGIQGNKYGLKNVSLRVFNVLDLTEGKLFDHEAARRALELLELEGVPQLGNIVLNHSVDDLVALAEGTSQLNQQTQREGIVLRPLAEEFDETLAGRLSLKAINPKFLLKYDE